MTRLRFSAALILATLSTALLANAQEPVSPPPVPPPSPVAMTYTGFTAIHPTVQRDWTSCEELKDACQGATWQEVLNAATNLVPTRIGLCYAHPGIDASGFPYAAHYYVKQSWREGAKGWDGGTGAIGTHGTQADAARAAGELLRQLCIAGACCCPVLDPQPCADPDPVDARDPKTGNSCSFPNRCTVPTGWTV